ncbi:MAG TPA: C-type lectin domain-containing protein [Polyangiales bacterium]|nr:C-type lectin domain-containing protein [Polyangiales bacterium]
MTREWARSSMTAATFVSLAACSVYDPSLIVGRASSSERSEDAGEFAEGGRAWDSGAVRDGSPATSSGDAAANDESDARPAPGDNVPSEDCDEQQIAGHVYYFCARPMAWSDALAYCKGKFGANLARIADGTQARLLAERTRRDAWIAHHVLRESLWVWSDNQVPFWHGGPDGEAVFGRLSTWASGQPEAGKDCGVLTSNAELGSARCADGKPFVCQRSPDGCPEDPAKRDPGQCGCGVADEDGDEDGFASCNDACDDDADKPLLAACGCDSERDGDGDGAADCNDGCPEDAKKTAAGGCGCGEPDGDADGDGVADCQDGCRDDARKQAPGQCGCGTADADTDRDGTADCKDGCPRDGSTVAACFPFAPANFDPKALDFGTAPNSRLDCGMTTVDTSSSPARITNWCGTPPTPLVRKLNNGPEVVVIPMRGLNVVSNNSLRLIGSRPVVLAVRGDATIAGVIDASASGATPGAGGNWSCASSQGGAGQGRSGAEAGGGGGGGFGVSGGRGGDDSGDAAPGAAGATRGNANLVPLIGGCSGGAAGGCANAPGAGGGAVQISASGKLVVTGAILTNGGNGGDNCGNDTGGVGGGSGGAILLESSATMRSGMLAANGGNGGAGDHGSPGPGSSAPDASGRNGGDGSGSGGGGGGGGYGRIVVR